MFNLVTKAAAYARTLLRQVQVKQLCAVLLIGMLVIGTTSPNTSAQPLEQKVRQRVEQANRETERPKTTGEFLDEARGDVPLNERIYNITRDSAEAFKDLGEEYPAAGLRNAKEKAAEAGQKLAEPLQR